MEVIVNALRVGSTRAVAAAYARLDEATLEDLMSRFPNFKQDIEQAEAEIQARVMDFITSRRPGWHTAAWWLERRYPQSRNSPPRVFGILMTYH